MTGKKIVRSRPKKAVRQKQKKPERLKRHRFPGAFTFDDQADAAYIYLSGPIPRGGCARTLEVKGNHDIYLDLDKNGRLLGVELLSKSLLPPALLATLTRRRA